MLQNPQPRAMSSILSSAAKTRILSDLKHLQEEPIPLAAAAPCSDDISLWNGIIGTQMEVTHIGFVTVPLHFLIGFRKFRKFKKNQRIQKIQKIREFRKFKNTENSDNLVHSENSEKSENSENTENPENSEKLRTPGTFRQFRISI